VNASGNSFGSITSPVFGIVIDTATGAVDYDERNELLGPCSVTTDPDMCRCAVGETDCQFAYSVDLLPELGLPAGVEPTYYAPTLVDKSFITTTQDLVSGRYTVVVDLRTYNAGGLVPKGNGFWANEASLRQWVTEMTGVPSSPGDSLFNFDYVQLGTSTPVRGSSGVQTSFNHFFLDAITDQFGRLFVGGKLTNLATLFNDDAGAPAVYTLTDPRVGDECSNSGNTDGVNGMRAKFCAYNTAVPVGDVTDLGVYALRTTVFDIEYNNLRTRQDPHFIIDGVLKVGFRIRQVPADSLEIESSFYVDNAGDPALTRTETTIASDAVGLSFSADRGDGEGGVCSRAVATRDGLAVRMDSADGAVPDSCVINGIF
jgi:hypothetical protein